MIEFTVMTKETGGALRVAAVVLAAGGSTRMGQSKQLLQVGGQPMVRRVTEVVCAANLEQVVVVAGAEAGAVGRALAGLPAEIVVNEAWAEGMSTSMQAGLRALRQEMQAVLIVLGDQPSLTTALLDRLVCRYEATGAALVVPYYRGQRGNPVLFDRSLFSELLTVEGDRGGREVLDRHLEDAEQVDVDNPAVVADIDTWQDYERIQDGRIEKAGGSLEQEKTLKMSTDNISQKRVTLVAATLASFLTPYMGSATNVALPSLGREFSMDAVLLSWVATAYLLAAAIFLVPFGRIADIYGRKKIFVYGTAVFTLASLLIGLSQTSTMLISARIMQGIGSAMIFGTGIAILTSVFPPNKRGQVLGINVAAVYVGLSMGPFVGGFLTERLGWRSIFFSIIPLGLVVIGFVVWRLKGEWAEAQGEPFDLGGSVIYSVSLVALMYGFSLLPRLAGAGAILAGAVGLALFAAWELRTTHPVLNVRLFVTNRTFAFSNLAALINYSATSAVTFLLSLYLQYIKALTPQQTGFVLIAQPIVQASVSPLAGRLSDRIEPRIVASAGMAITALGLTLLIFVGPSTPLWLIIADLTLLGLGFGLFSSPNTNAIMGSVERRLYGVASGTVGTMRLMGQMLSMGIATLLFALYIGRVEIAPETYALFLLSAKTAFAIFSALCVGGIFASLTRGKLH